MFAAKLSTKILFYTAILLLSVNFSGCSSTKKKTKQKQHKIMPEVKKVSNKEKIPVNKKTYPKIELPGDIKKEIKLDDNPKTIAKQKSSYVYYKPVSVKPSEKPIIKSETNSTSDSPAIIYDKRPKNLKKTNKINKNTLKMIKTKDLTDRLIKQ